MAVPWLVCLGFVLVYSALLAKLRRIKEQQFRRAQVPRGKVAITIACLLAAMLVILITWQLVSPLVWVRDITDTDPITGYPIESIGYCASDHFGAFAGTCAIFMAFCLAYALVSHGCSVAIILSVLCNSTQFQCLLLKVLCYQTRSMPIEFSESKYVSFFLL